MAYLDFQNRHPSHETKGRNRLIEGRLTDRPDGVAFYGQRVRVERR